MPYDEPDATDPQMLIGVGLPAEPGTMTDMAYILAEEFARMGFDARRILRVFSDPFYAGAYRVYQALGAEAVTGIVDDCVRVWGRERPRGA